MDNQSEAAVITEEEALVAELDLLGINYLSRQTAYQTSQVRAPDVLLADLVRQPHARVRAAVIAVLLSRPEYAKAVPAALERLSPQNHLTLQALYMAAVLLQREHAEALQPFLGKHWRWLPDILSQDLNLPREGTPRERLKLLDREVRHRTNAKVNWVGTYEQVAQKLLRDWEMRNQRRK
jgi:alkanesulfonate monooxygenase SsuD/methylene tetrahydromethanopterin reductase-like flavin-dependent oxidoreductase (luciferase family)